MTAAPDHLSATFAALADPTRRAILERLALGECSVSELAGPFAMSLPAVSKHLRVLERAGLITQRRDAQRRPCRIEAEPLRAATDWADHVRATWEARFDRLDAYLAELTREPRRDAPSPPAPSPPAPSPPAPGARPKKTTRRPPKKENDR
jgi:DNA-binding transcriptional ArsR family regulator